MMTVVFDYTALLTPDSWNGPGDTGTPAIITYSFEDMPQSYLARAGYSAAFIASFQSFSSTDRQMAQDAINDWANACGLTVIEVPSGMGDIRYAKYDLTLSDVPGAAGFADLPSRAIKYASNYDAYDILTAGDMFIDRNFGVSPFLIRHETGHALGFKHPFEGDPTLDPSLIDGAHTIMGYDGPTYVGHIGSLDMQAAAYVYGSAASDGSNHASWSWNAATLQLTQTGKSTDDVMLGTNVSDIMDGADGNDFLAGFGGNDRLTGGNGNNTLNGGVGNDTLVGGLGTNTLVGAAAGTPPYLI